MLEQYLQFYKRYSSQYGPKTCILMLVGSFYELYDKVNAAGEFTTPIRQLTEIMNIALVDKQNGSVCAGFKDFTLHKFAQTLTREGWTVVVIDQVKDSKNAVTDRVATRILSPGTHVETATQDRMCVAALWLNSKKYAASVLDLTTGETFSFSSHAQDDILHMFQVYGVKEVVASGPENCIQDESVVRSQFGIHCAFHFSKAPMQLFESSAFRREEYIRRLFRVKSLLPVRAALGLPEQDASMELSLTLLLQFVEDHFPQQCERLTSHSVYSPAQHMRLSNNILEQLNIIAEQRSVLSLLERTHSAIGKRALRERILRPITDEKELVTRWGQVEWSTKLPTVKRQVLERCLKSLYDLPRLHFHFAEGTLESNDICQLFQTYSATVNLIREVSNTPLALSDEYVEAIKSFREHARRLLDEEKAIARNTDGFVGFLTPISGPKTAVLEEQIVELQEQWKKKWQMFCTEVGVPPDSFKLEKKGDGELVWEGPRSLRNVLSKVSSSILVLS